MARKTAEAFVWITDTLRKHDIPFQISGGLAARIYGSRRKLADIDIGVPDKRLKKTLSDVADYVIYGPKRYVDSEWDLLLLTLRYQGQDIDIYGNDSMKLFDRKNNVWVNYKFKISDSVIKKVYGRNVPVIPKEQLISYKQIIMRDVDRKDLKILTRH